MSTEEIQELGYKVLRQLGGKYLDPVVYIRTRDGEVTSVIFERITITQFFPAGHSLRGRLANADPAKGALIGLVFFDDDKREMFALEYE